jgi:hypothetical protein
MGGGAGQESEHRNGGRACSKKSKAAIGRKNESFQESGRSGKENSPVSR